MEIEVVQSIYEAEMAENMAVLCASHIFLYLINPLVLEFCFPLIFEI